jgi:NAD(P)-dependent dehydrogenase (short-subunit alcohol dehydrogenase family)
MARREHRTIFSEGGVTVLLERMLPWVGSFSGQVAVVTGASSEIGRSTALALARCGANVALVSRRRAGLTALQAAIRSYGRRALAIPADVSDAASAREALMRVRRSWGKVDLLINNAGTHASAHSLGSDDVDELMRRSLLGATFMAEAALPFMYRQKSGTIVNVAPPTERAVDGSWGGSLASKFALIGFTQTLRSEIRSSRLELSLVLPDGGPYVESGQGATLIPPAWVAAATLLAAKFHLAEISTPPGPSTVEALRATAPLAAEAVSGWASAAHRLFSGRDEADVSRRLPGELLRLAVH